MKRSRWRSRALRAALAGLLLGGPALLATAQAQPGAGSTVLAPAPVTAAGADTGRAASGLTPEEAMELANRGELQAPVPVPASPATSPQALPQQPEAAGPPPREKEGGAWKWGLGILLGLVMGYFLARILNAKPRPVSPGDEAEVPSRSRHQRGNGTNPASRQEQEISKSLHQQFQQATQPTAAVPAPEPKEPAPAPQSAAARRPPAANTPKVNQAKASQAKAAKPSRPMPENTPAAPATPALPPSITELIDEGAAAQPAAAAPAPAAPAGPVQFYAPAPDVPSIEHRKLSPNPLPQMPILVKLTNPDAAKAEFCFSPQADQSRIIGNGVRELKEFFAFELPPTEQFTSIKNLTPGKLEKRDDTWHVVQKASIALS